MLNTDIDINESIDDLIYSGSLVSAIYESEMLIYESFVDTFFDKFGKSPRTKEAFKKYYNFTPLKPSHPDIGKITFADGREYVVDLEDTSMVAVPLPFKGNFKIHTQRTTAAVTSSYDSRILIDKDFWDLSKSEQEYVLGHEVGHLNMHSTNIKNKNLNKTFIRWSTIMSMIKDTMKDVSGGDVSQAELGIFAKLFMVVLKKDIKDYYLQAIQNNPDDELDHIRRDIICKYVTEYYELLKKSGEPVKNNHLNVAEIEADLFGVNSTKDKNPNLVSSSLNKVIGNAEKQVEERKKELDKKLQEHKISQAKYDKEVSKYDLILKQVKAETEIRQRAVKDRKLRKSKYYKMQKKTEN